MENLDFLNNLTNDYKLIKKQNDEFNQEEVIYENFKNNKLICKKYIGSNEFSKDLLEMINKKINILKINSNEVLLSPYLYTNEEIIGNEVIYFNYFEDYNNNWENLIEKQDFDYNILEKLLFDLIKVGCYLENNFEFHPSLIPKNIKIQKMSPDYKILLTNPYSYKDYYLILKNQFIPILFNLDENINLQQLLTNGKQRSVLIKSLNNKFLNSLYKFFIKNIQKNLYDIAIIIICFGTKTKFESIYEYKSGKFNDNWENILNNFLNRFENTLVGKFIKFIFENVNNLPTFLDLEFLLDKKNTENKNIDVLLNNIKNNLNKNNNNKNYNDLLNLNKKELYPINYKKETYYQVLNSNNNNNLNEISKDKNKSSNNYLEKEKDNFKIFNKEKIKKEKKNSNNNLSIENEKNEFILKNFNKPCNYSYDPVFYKIPYCTCKEPYNVQAYFPPSPILFYSKNGFENPFEKEKIVSNKQQNILEKENTIENNIYSKENNDNILKKTINKLNTLNFINNKIKKSNRNLENEKKQENINNIFNKEIKNDNKNITNNSIFKPNNISNTRQNLKNKKTALEQMLNDDNDQSFMKKWVIKSKFNK